MGSWDGSSTVRMLSLLTSFLADPATVWLPGAERRKLDGDGAVGWEITFRMVFRNDTVPSRLHLDESVPCPRLEHLQNVFYSPTNEPKTGTAMGADAVGVTTTYCNIASILARRATRTTGRRILPRPASWGELEGPTSTGPRQGGTNVTQRGWALEEGRRTPRPNGGTAGRTSFGNWGKRARYRRRRAACRTTTTISFPCSDVVEGRERRS